MKFTIGSVVTLKLNSGEELIAKIISEVDEHGFVQLQDPVSVAPGPQGMGLIPSLFTSDPAEPVRLNTASVSLLALTDDLVKDKYITAITGIQIPEKKIILG